MRMTFSLGEISLELSSIPAQSQEFSTGKWISSMRFSERLLRRDEEISGLKRVICGEEEGALRLRRDGDL